MPFVLVGIFYFVGFMEHQVACLVEEYAYIVPYYVPLENVVVLPDERLQIRVHVCEHVYLVLRNLVHGILMENFLEIKEHHAVGDMSQQGFVDGKYVHFERLTLSRIVEGESCTDCQKRIFWQVVIPGPYIEIRISFQTDKDDYLVRKIIFVFIWCRPVEFLDSGIIVVEFYNTFSEEKLVVIRGRKLRPLKHFISQS